MHIRPIDLAAKALCDIKTSRRWLKPSQRQKMKPAVAERVRRAAVELGWNAAEEPKAACQLLDKLESAQREQERNERLSQSERRALGVDE